MTPDGRNLAATVLAITDAEGNAMESCPHPQQEIHVKFDVETEAMDILRICRG